MKYSRLTKEQFEELHPEFINFLAAQQIDKNEWDKIKEEKPEVAEQELDIFSDLIWEGVLTNAKYLEHYSKSHIFLFGFDDKEIKTIVIKSKQSDIDLLSKEGLQWLSDAVFTEDVEVRHGGKSFGENRNEEIFSLIQQGAILSDGHLYGQFKEMLKL
ncbi:hypothetical protein HX045_07525 [Myroides odoratimimus]|uniref:Uncharacterized protein n=4 Tax=Myroides TaxID=76831 RepID=A0A0S7EEN3_9FLAO|nr:MULTISPECIES: DUF6495 family protein [Myroides]AJH16086.1 histidyl-tRNA synthetase [Myroides profundi]ALU24925.1 hypothetical protein AS202_01510 [Myroides odoratimimus]APA90949.1 hypothetical protein BK054_01610 [Myroides sp. ZB35]EHO05794.1 hypothetical protein HMPREF9712_03370 [Myroides odoratimimus CCUG 10230]EHO06310.1 hypothetical protein HMPREF9715_03031 [Myroides odoratimimus CIP 101113]